MFPLFHMAGWTIALSQWQARDAVVFAAADPVAIADAVARHGAARLNCIPLVWRRILDAVAAGDVAADAFASLRFADTGTSATPPELLDAIRALVPQATVRVFYGSTEAGNVASLEMADFGRKPGRVGVPSLFTRARIGADGELEVTGPLLFDGYFEDDAATDLALVDGWYRTGDLADLDVDGFVTITGRAHATIRTGGETVAPTEVEQALRAHPGVADLAVVGMPDPDYGEVVCAAVVVRDGAAATLEDLRTFGAAHLAGYKLPRRVELVTEIPRTPATGQVQRHLLVERLAGR
jgi:acyl-CoA synthetase (AMP-forming)/AMP-acid ligase II